MKNSSKLSLGQKEGRRFDFTLGEQRFANVKNSSRLSLGWGGNGFDFDTRRVNATHREKMAKLD